MGSASASEEARVRPEAAEADYAQFAQRNLDKLSWLYPLVNNKIGARLNLQLRHTHIFFIKDGSVVDEIGYGEKSKRFHERDVGREMHSLSDITACGFWFLLPKYNAQAVYEALEEVKDGSYYSLFSNQCQDWAGRVRAATVRIQKAKDLPVPKGQEESKELYKEVAPVVPAAWYLGMLAIAVGVLGIGAPIAAGYRYLQFVAVLLLAIGVSDIIYAFSSQAWRTFLATMFFGLLSIAGAVVLWSNDRFLIGSSNGVLALILCVEGLARIGVAVKSRPFTAWIGTFITGLLLLTTAWVAWKHRDGSAAGWLLGVSLSVSFISAGISTIWLNWNLKNKTFYSTGSHSENVAA